MNQVLCNKCNKEITTTSYVKCFSCNSNYHFSPCCSLSEFTYANMYGERKSNWKCYVCKARSKSPVASAAVPEQQKKQRSSDDESPDDQNRTKIFKDSLSLDSVKSTLCSVQSDVSELKTNMKEMNDKFEQVVNTINTSHLQIKEEIQSALSTITTNISKLVDQVNDLTARDKMREEQIKAMDIRVNKLEQKIIERNIEIKNVNNPDLTPYDVVKSIAFSLNVDIKEADISNAYRIKKQSDQIIVEFSSLNKKRELMGKIVRHRVDAQLVNNEESNIKYVYINDELTFHNRQLLWIAKTKAKEANWKFVWVRDGKIYARKNENSSLILINNAADIELIVSTN